MATRTKELKIKPQRRFFTLDRAAVNEEERTVDLSFCTESPVERWFGIEILDCAPESVRLDRLKATGPLLFNHDPDNLIGKVEKVWMGADRKGYATVRLSTADDVNAIWQKVQDGTLDNVSVGYMIDKMVLEKSEGDMDTYRATSWTPYEISLVSIPADVNCGVGREAEEREICITIEISDEEEPCEGCDDPACADCNPPAAAGEKNACATNNKGEKTMSDKTPEQIAKETRTAELERINTIRTLGDKHNAGAEAARFMEEGKSVDEFRTFLLDRPAAPVMPAEPAQRQQVITASPRYDLRSLEPFRERGKVSLQDAESRAFEAGQFALATIYGSESARKWCKEKGVNLRAMSEGVGSAGGYVVPDSLSTAIIDFRLQYGVARKLAQFQPMGSASMTVPVVGSGPTAYFGGENTNLTAADLALGQVELMAKKLTALTLLSNEVQEDAAIDLGALVADRMGYSFAGKEDQCLVDGDGTSTYGGIIGLKAKLEAAGMAGIYTCATNTDSPQEVILGELNGLMAKLPSYARNGARFLTSPAFDELIFGRLMAAAGGNSTTTLAGEIVAAFLGKAREVNEFCYADATADLTGKAMVFYGNFKQGVLFGERRGITMQVLTERYADQDSIGIKATERIDINCHGVGTTSAAGPIVALIGG